MFGYISKLIDKDNPKRANVAVLITTCAVMSIAVLFLAIGSLWINKNLAAELGICVTGLCGLSGTAYVQAKKYATPSNTITENKEQ